MIVSRRNIICMAAMIPMLLSCGRNVDTVDSVNPYIGNISHLLVPTYPTVQRPNSMLRVYPEREDYTGEKIKGFPVIVTSHRGKSAFNLSLWQGDEDGLLPYYFYHYDNEKITPYSYGCYLPDEDVSFLFSPTERAAVYEFDFGRKDGPKWLILNAGAKGSLTGSEDVSGWQYIDDKTKVYIYVRFTPSPAHSVFRTDGGDNYVALEFSQDADKVEVRYGISFISEDQASENLSETDGKTIEDIIADGRASWNTALDKIKVKGVDENARIVFYTALYRTYERMVDISENGRYYSAFDGKVHEDSVDFYTDDWLWDTYRAVHPLRTIIEPEMETDMIRSFIRMAEQSDRHWMPTFPEVTGDSRRMNSNHGVATIADAIAKGLNGFDVRKAYEYCRSGITEKTLAPWSGCAAGPLTEFYWEHGYIPALKDGEDESYAEVHPFERRQPVAVTLGTSYDTWCLASIAEYLNFDEDCRYFREKSLNYRNIFNYQTKFFHPKDENGDFIQPFDYERSGGLGARGAYGENNGWIYRWDVPHNIPDLINLMGGKQAFSEELDRMFSTPLGCGKYEFYSQLPDHTGNVGQFSMANEPSMHIPYLYVYAGEPWKTQRCIRKLLEEWFRNDLMGIPGDEDGGGMSAFVVFSMLGFYPVTPGLPVYVIGSPCFEEAVISLPQGKEFRITCRNYSPEHKYIQSARLNGEVLDRSWFTHKELMDGGCLEFFMGAKPNKKWATEDTPPTTLAEIDGI